MAVPKTKSWHKDFPEWVTTSGALKSAAPAEVKQAVFISRAREVHGSKYNYLKAKYTKAKDKVTIICREHGEFEQEAFSHLQGMGCARCSGNYTQSTEMAVDQFKEVHGSRYDYSKVKYINVTTRVTIICSEHGEFEQLPAVHKRGNGCPKCADEKIGQARKLTQEEVIKQFVDKHGDLYDYSKVQYVNHTTKVTIICSVHGEFQQSPADHKASGCLRCGGRYKMTTSEIIEQFKVTHGKAYDYSKVHYVNSRTKVTIICPKHGEFEQAPTKHKSGHGCPKCIGKGLSTDEVIAEFKEVHGDRYGYDKVVYIGTIKKVTINCRVHGDFQQTPHKHRQGDGCPACGTTSADMNQPARLYLLVSDCGSMMKIGITSEARVHGDRFTENQKNVEFEVYKVEDFLFMSGYECYAAEQELLSKSEKMSIEQKDGSISKEWVVFDSGIIEFARSIHKQRGLIGESDHRPVGYFCDTHGVYLETPYNTKLGKGCPECEKECKALNDPRRLTQEQVIEGFRETHGDRYDYSDIEYKGAVEKVKIICRKHGSFMQMPSAHKQGSNCPKCAYENRPKTKKVITTESLISEFKVAHGDKYDYSLVDYVDHRTKVIIICPKHGKFKQAPFGHKSGSGCMKCGIESRIKANTQSWEAVLGRFSKAHGNRYDYSKVKYVDALTKVTIVCPEHGEFEQTPQAHYKGKGCYRCTYDKRNVTRTAPREDVLVEFKRVHGNKYDYSKAVYVNMTTPIKIICPKHGEFKQEPTAHKQGQGCRKCAYEKLSEKLKFTKEDVILAFQNVHGDKYDYSKVRYGNNSTKVTIICPEHGEFQQSPNAHKSGAGCLICSGKYKLSHSEVIAQFKDKHSNRYDYSKVKYVDTVTKVTIVCPEHGEFQQSPNAHKRGAGCPDCAGNKRNSIELVIASFVATHGEKYDYSKMVYKNASTPITITCPIHGNYEQAPARHRNGLGCPICRKNEKNRKTIAKFIAAAKEVHGNKYTYKPDTYQGVKNKVAIVCPMHGEFMAFPSNHRLGQGCPKCK